MRGRLSKYIFVVLLCLWSANVFAQVSVRATVSTGKILIGEPVALTVEAYMPLGVDFTWISSDTIPHFQVTEVGNVDTLQNMDSKKVSQTLTITSFDSGTQYVPPFEILINGQAFYTDSVQVDVLYTPFDPNADYRDIKDIIEIVNDSVKYIPWVLGALAVLSLAGLVYILRRSKAKQQDVVKPLVPLLSPYEEAMKSLSELKASRGIGVKEYYSSLNDILRRYLSREYGISTFERTSEELIMQISRLGLAKESYLNLAQSLRMSDFVKFAKYTPADADNEKNFETVANSIGLLNKRLVSAV